MSSTTASASAAALRGRARVLRQFATKLEGLEVLQLYLRAGTDTWMGPTPAKCAAELQSVRGGFVAAANELRSTAARLERRADDVEAAARAAARAAALAAIN